MGALASATVVGRAAEPAPAPAASGNLFTVDDQVRTYSRARRLRIMRGSRRVAALIFPTDYPAHFRLKPELHNVCTPSGVPVTGTHEYCFVHQQSIMCGHGSVQTGDRVVDFFRTLPFPDPARMDKWHPNDPGHNLFHLGPTGVQEITQASWKASHRVVVRLEVNWRTRILGEDGGDSVLTEERLYALHHQGDGTVVDVFSRLSPVGPVVTLLKETGHGYLGVRVHDLIDAEDGGELRDSEGRKNPSGHFRGIPGDLPAPRWIDCTGQIGNATVGMTLMGHPANIRNQWYMHFGEFGLMMISAAATSAVKITATSPFAFAARFVAHDGPLGAAAADQLYDEFAKVEARHLREFVGS